MINFISKKRIFFISIIIIMLTIAIGLYTTYALNVTVQETTPTTYNMALSFDLSNTLNMQLTVPAGKTKLFDLDITNPYSDAVKYGVAYSMVSPTTLPSGLIIAQTDSSPNSSTGLVNASSTATVSVIIVNDSSSSVTVSLSVINGYKNGGNLIVPTGKTLVDDIYYLSLSGRTLTNLGLSLSSGTPDFSKTSCSSGCLESTVGIYEKEDDLGTSYYFRGDVTNNYVYFARYYWRIIRINGDGTVRIFFDGREAYANGVSSIDRALRGYPFNANNYDNAHVGYMYGNADTGTTYAATHANTNDSLIKTMLEDWYRSDIADMGYSGFVADAIYCNDRSLYSGSGTNGEDTRYGIYGRGSSPILTCPQVNDKFTVSSNIGNGKLNYPIGLITGDEVRMAGGSEVRSGGTYANKSFYLYNGNIYYTMTPHYTTGGYAYLKAMWNTGVIADIQTNTNTIISGIYNGAVNPVISLKASAIKEGTGTATDPYRVYRKGDVNRDGKINQADVDLCSDYDVEAVYFDDEQLFLGDVTGDGIVDVEDILKISRYIAGTITEL